VTHAPMKMSVTANDARNWFIGFWRRRGVVTMAAKTRRLPVSVINPTMRFRALNAVSNDLSQDECSVILVSATELFAIIFV